MQQLKQIEIWNRSLGLWERFSQAHELGYLEERITTADTTPVTKIPPPQRAPTAKLY